LAIHAIPARQRGSVSPAITDFIAVINDRHTRQ
jgi:hypothetical protein